jgi:CBS domain-containing protein
LTSPPESSGRHHPGYPGIDSAGKVLGVITRSNFMDHWIGALSHGEPVGKAPIIAYDLVDRQVVTAYPGESCRTVADRRAQANVKRLLIVSPDESVRLIGIVSLGDLLRARHHLIDEESRRERFYRPGRTVREVSG